MAQTKTYHNKIDRKKDDFHELLIQRKLEWFRMEENGELGNDPLEKEADDSAQKIVHGDGIDAGNLSSASSQPQGKADDNSVAMENSISPQLESSKGGGQQLDDSIKGEMESQMNTDLNDVRVHTDSTANKMSEDINAKAFAHGQDIYFKDGNFDTNSNEGKELLAHELTHTQQQGERVNRKIQRQIEDPEIRYILDQTEPAEGFNKLYYDFYQQGLIGFSDLPISEKGKAPISVYVDFNGPIGAGDPTGTGYVDYLTQTYQIAQDVAKNKAKTYLDNGISIWKTFDSKALGITRDDIDTSPFMYIRHLFGQTVAQQNLLFLEEYLLKKSGLITPDTSVAINADLTLLQQLPSSDVLLVEFNAVNAPKPNPAFDDYRTNYQVFETPVDNTDYVNPHIPPVPLFPQTPTNENEVNSNNPYPEQPKNQKELLVDFVEKHEGINKKIGGRPELKNFVTHALMRQMEENILAETTKPLDPGMYSSYLEFQKQTIYSSELYAELNVARNVYQQYWNHCWEIFNNNNTAFNGIRTNSQKAESNLGTYTNDRATESAQHDWFPIWNDVLQPVINDTTFEALKKEYPDIPFASEQFKTLWIENNGMWIYTPPPTHIPSMDDEGNMTLEESKGVSFVEDDRDIVNMLAGGFSITLEKIGSTNTLENELSLTDQLGVMVTQLETIESTQNAIDQELVGQGMNGSNAIPLPAVLIPPYGFEETITLSLYLEQVAEGEWKIIDFSNPTGQTPTYTGKASADEKDRNKLAILKALIEFANSAAYPEGDIIAEGPKDVMGPSRIMKAHSTGKNWSQEAAANLSTGATVAGILGLVLMFTPLAPLGAGLIFLSGISGAAAAGLRIADRIEHETFELNAETMMDVIDIVSGVIVAGKMASTFYKATTEVTKAAKVSVLVRGVETGADVATAVIIGDQYLRQLEKVEEDFNNGIIDKATRDAERERILQEAALVGLLLIIGYAAPKMQKRFGVSRQPLPEKKYSPREDSRFVELSKTSSTRKSDKIKAEREAETILQAENEGIVQNPTRPDKHDPDLDFKIDGPEPYKWADTKRPVDPSTRSLDKQSTETAANIKDQKAGSADVLHIVDLQEIPQELRISFKESVISKIGNTDGIIFINL